MYFRFVDDVVFAHSRTRGDSVDAVARRVISMRLRAQANAAAASYWLRWVPKLDESTVKGCEGGAVYCLFVYLFINPSVL